MGYMDGAKFVHSKKDVPNKEHWVILKFKTWYVPGDERSRTNPGHGYGEHYESGVDYIAYEKEEDWKKEIINMEQSKHNKEDYVAFKVSKPVTTKTTVSVDIE